MGVTIGSEALVAAATNFNTSNSTFRQLLGNGLSYRIPRFQRDYSWTADEWEDLWLDILGTVKESGEPAHYMGYLVLQSDDDKRFDVIDGQQRLTTISLVVLAVLKNLQRLIDSGPDAENNVRRRDQIRQSYIGYLDPVTLVSRSKLALNRNNEHYYQTYLVPLGTLPQRGFRASEHSLRRAFEWFDGRVREHVSRQEGDKGVALAQFVENMSDRLFFTVITVTDELNAYKVFETLNSRGVRLSATDLLKNYLFSVLDRGGQHEHELKSLEDRWESLVGRLGAESFPDFLRVHWNSRHAPVRQTELFKTIRNDVNQRANVFTLLREMEDDLDTYLALTQPEASNWPPEWKSDAALLRMFSVRQPFPMLLAVKRALDDQSFAVAIHACVVISYRYNVIGSLSTSDQERVYATATAGVLAATHTSSTAILSALSQIYPSDAVFRASFADKAIGTTQSRNKRIVRYTLAQIEKHCSGAHHDFDSDTFNIEHVLPQNPDAGWEAFPEGELENYIYRLGNMTLLESSANRDLGASDYAAKRAAYEKSGFQITAKLAEDNASWDPERLQARQNWMANQAVAIWRLAQLS